MTVVVGVAALALATKPVLREPDIVQPMQCDTLFSRAGWADLDRDGRLDLITTTASPFLQVWPSTVASPVATRVYLGDGTESVFQNYPGDMAMDAGPPARFAFKAEAADEVVAFVEYEIDPNTWSAVERWREAGPPASVRIYVGDIDGDGNADISIGQEVRLSSSGLRVPLPPDTRDGRELEYVSPVGDLDGDGFDDLLVAYREEVYDDVGYTGIHGLWGPAALFLGSPTGYPTEPLWEWSDPSFAVGRSAVRPGPGDSLVLTLIDENVVFSQEDIGLLVLHNAGTSSPVAAQQIPFVDTSYTHGWRIALFPEEGDEVSVVLMGQGGQGYRWYPWNEIDDTVGVLPIAYADPFNLDTYYDAWSATEPKPVSSIFADSRVYFGWAPPGDLAALPTEPPDDCEWPPPPPKPPVYTDPTDTGTDTAAPPGRPKDPPDCGCAFSGGAGGPAAVAAFAGLWVRHRRRPYATGASGSPVRWG